MPATVQKATLQTTVRIPRRLYEEARCVVEQGDTDAGSLNELLVNALSEKVRRIKRQMIDREFANMGRDAQYQRESRLLEEQFKTNDRETIRSAERNKS
jgi:hypothetical protein